MKDAIPRKDLELQLVIARDEWLRLRSLINGVMRRMDDLEIRETLRDHRVEKLEAKRKRKDRP